MLAKLEQHRSPLTAAEARRIRHLLIVLPKVEKPAELKGIPHLDALEGALGRRKKTVSDLRKSPVTTDLPHGALVSWIVDDPERPIFERHTVMRKALQPLLAEHPATIGIAVFGAADAKASAAEAAVYVASVNGARLPERKKKTEGGSLQTIRVYGHQDGSAYASLRARAEGNVLCRELTVLPPNELTPGSYRQRLRHRARQEGWRIREYDMKRLRRMRAGAFVAVAQGSELEDAAIVHLAYRPRGARKKIALVGKGICFDTGGHNLKPARYMAGMHEDMNGSAVALGILVAASRSKLPVAIDCWLAIAQNHISPKAYKQNDIVTALNGTTIEIVHTDAEGRMVLSDTLTLAAREKPDVMIGFATLTGSMHTALGDRYSGIFVTGDDLAREALSASAAAGERVCVFPMDEDYDQALDSPVADVKQCTLEGAADHILAARLLKRFTEDRPWIHMDLSGSSCKGGLGAVATDVTGFGVAWGHAFLESLAET
ncbi:MAG TPA: leucyl aminopeptidase family protein [Burkholderiales bacterium]|nr:leucyl aminopeptidase family protein [Burkholderiales bacterium]